VLRIDGDEPAIVQAAGRVFVPTTAGIPHSGAAIEAWAARDPPLVTTAAARPSREPTWWRDQSVAIPLDVHRERSRYV